VAKFLGTTTAQVRKAWPAELAEVSVAGTAMWLPPEELGALRAAAKPALVRLLLPSDPYLQIRNRDLLLPDAKRQKELWRVLATPGALLVDGEIAGTWRAKLAGRGRLQVTVTPFDKLTAAAGKAVETEAGHVAAARDVEVRIQD
jgi:hypothetical protein